jgi:hypothetical protein
MYQYRLIFIVETQDGDQFSPSGMNDPVTGRGKSFHVSYFTIDNGSPRGYLEKASRGGGIPLKNSAAGAGLRRLPFTVLANETTDIKIDEETRACTQEESRACLQEPYAHATAGAGVYKHVVSTIIFVTT